MATIKEKDLFLELGDTGLMRHDGWITEDFLKQLRNLDNRVQTYKEMRDNDAYVGAALYAISMLIRRVEWRAEAASASQEDQEAANFLQSCMDDMSDTWADTIDEILSMLTYGFSYHEVIYKRREGAQVDPRRDSRFFDGRIGWRKLPIRSQDTVYKWEFGENGSLRGMVQQNPTSYQQVFIPIEKALLFRPGAHKNNPEGRSVLRNAFTAYYKKKHIENIEGIGIERDLAGLPVALVPPEIMKPTAPAELRAVYDQVKKIITNIRRDEQEGIVFPASYDDNGRALYEIKLLSTGGSRQFDTTAVINRYNQAIVSSVLADFILLGHETHGSFALSSSKTSLFTTAIGAYLESIAQVFNRIAVPKLFALNSMRVDTLPKVAYGDIETVDLKDLGGFIKEMTAAGAQLFPDAKVEDWMKRQAGMPVPDEPPLGSEVDQGADEQIQPQDVFSSKDQEDKTTGQTGELSMEHVRMLIEINSAVTTNKLSRPQAVEIAERALSRPRSEVELLIRSEGAASV